PTVSHNSNSGVGIRANRTNADRNILFVPRPDDRWIGGETDGRSGPVYFARQATRRFDIAGSINRSIMDNRDALGSDQNVSQVRRPGHFSVDRKLGPGHAGTIV